MPEFRNLGNGRISSFGADIVDAILVEQRLVTEVMLSQQFSGTNGKWHTHTYEFSQHLEAVNISVLLRETLHTAACRRTNLSSLGWRPRRCQESTMYCRS